MAVVSRRRVVLDTPRANQKAFDEGLKVLMRETGTVLVEDDQHTFSADLHKIVGVYGLVEQLIAADIFSPQDLTTWSEADLRRKLGLKYPRIREIRAGLYRHFRLTLAGETAEELTQLIDVFGPARISGPIYQNLREQGVRTLAELAAYLKKLGKLRSGMPHNILDELRERGHPVEF